MDKEQVMEAIKVMQAWLDGEEIEFKYHNDRAWSYVPAWKPLSWDWYRLTYRVKPKKNVGFLLKGPSPFPMANTGMLGRAQL